MKIKKTLFSLFAITLFATACSNDTKDQSGTDEIQGKALVQLSIDNSFYGTRAFPDKAAAVTETDIYNYAVLVFNSNRILEHTLYKRIAGLDGTPDNPATGKLETEQFEVTLGQKYFFVVANVPVSQLMQDQDDFSPGNDVLTTGIQEYIFELDTIDQIMGYLNSGDDVNLNDKNRGFMMTSLTGLAPHNITIDKETGQVNNVTLQLGRAMAKVSLTDDLDPVTQANLWGTLEDVEYKVGNNPKKMYVVPHYHQNTDIIMTPNYDDASVDQNAYFGPLDGYQPSSKSGNITYTYCTENANQVPKMGNATVTYIKGKFVPNDDYIFAADRVTSAYKSDLSNGTFWRIKDTATDSYIDPNFYAGDPTSSLTAGEKVVEYTEGICYYTLYLQNPARNDNDKYSVKRNSLYKVTLTKVNGVGEADEDDLIPDIELPLDASGLVEATIELVPWDEIDWDTEI